jgi:hypothetical protein
MASHVSSFCSDSSRNRKALCSIMFLISHISMGKISPACRFYGEGNC